MILERAPNNNRRQIEENYRKQLYNQIQEKQTLKNKSRIIQKSAGNGQFSLIKNIEQQQQKRANKRREYYAELEEQRQEAIRLKKQKQQDQKRYQRQMDQKIARDNEVIRKRHQEQIRKEKGKKQKVNHQQPDDDYRNQPPTDPIPRKYNFQQNQPQNPPLKYLPMDSLDQIQQSRPSYGIQQSRPSYGIQQQQRTSYDIHQQQRTSYGIQQQQRTSYGIQQQQRPSFQNIEQHYDNHLYSSRMQNQQFNFAPRRNFNTGYYQDLIMEKRRFQQETSSLRQLNRMLGAERNYLRKAPRTGIQSLKQLEKMLEDQSAGYLHQQSFTHTNMKGRAKTHNSTNYFDF